MMNTNGHWKPCRLGDCLRLVNGRAFKPTEWKKNGLPIVRIQNLNNPDAPFNYYEGQLPEKFLLDDGDLLFAWSGTPGTSFGAHIWRGGKAWLNQHIFKVRFDEKQFDKRYLQLAINRNLEEYIRAAHGGAGLAHITKGRFEESLLPVPPLDEQKRIVAEIEKQFTRLDAGVASLKQVQGALRRYRDSVLNAACEGRLVPKTSDWKQIPLKELIGVISQGWSPKCDLTRGASADEWAVVTTTAVQSMRYVDNQAKPLPPELAPRPKLEIQPGDFLMTRKGPRKRAGVTCLVRSTRRKLILCDTVYRFRCDESSVTPDYLELALNSPAVVRLIDRQKAGINESGVSLTHGRLGVVSIPVPTIPEQMLIVAEVHRRLSVLEELDTLVRASDQRAVRLRQSILQSVFACE